MHKVFITTSTTVEVRYYVIFVKIDVNI